MKISKISLFTLALIFILSTKVSAEGSSSNWFVGSRLNISTLDDEVDSSSSIGIDVLAGYQFGKFLKLMVGAGSTTTSQSESAKDSDGFTSLFATVRPQWEFDSGFLVYIDVGVLTSSEGDGGKIGYGLGYNAGKHEITVGYETTIIDTRDIDTSGVALQYSYHF